MWVRGDLEASNILVSGGQLIAVIDFGNCAVGDPTCDLVMAWTYFDDKEQEVFRSAFFLIKTLGKEGRLGRFGKRCLECLVRWN